MAVDVNDHSWYRTLGIKWGCSLYVAEKRNSLRRRVSRLPELEVFTRVHVEATRMKTNHALALVGPAIRVDI
jgi:hypothetical protein